MNYNTLGKTDYQVSELSFGTWAIGGSWGKTNDEESLRALHKAMDEGVNFFDTADVYGDGHSEKLLREATKGKEDTIKIASKFCRKGDIHDPKTYEYRTVKSYLEDTLRRLGRETLDLYQIHCPPIEILREGSVFHVLDELKKEGKIKHYGVSVETVEEGLICLQHENVSTLQVIFNMMRQKPLDELFPRAAEQNVGIIARVPLASGLLTGKFSKDHQFEQNDHRHFNKDGKSFNVGETFGGLPFETGVDLANQLSWIKDEHGEMAQAALKWVMQQPGVSTAIPGFKNTKQVISNLGATKVKPYTADELNRLRDFYHQDIHQHIRGAY